MSQGEDETEKQFDPTQKKLEDARKKGEVPRSTDLTTAAAYCGFLLVALSLGAKTLGDLGSVLTKLIAQPDYLSANLFSGGHIAVFSSIILEAIKPLLAWFAVPAAAALLTIIAQQSFVVAPSKLAPKISKISFISNAKNKFGRQGLFEFLKSFSKLLVYSIFLGVFLTNHTPEIAAAVTLEPAAVTAMMLRLTIEFLLVVLLVSGAIGGIDFLWQNSEHIRKNRMSRQELVDESKQMEGDPHIKQQRRQKAQEIALTQMMADVPSADVIVVNPTHFAVALKWSRAPGEAPVCVAKGVDSVAARIREIAQESGVPVQHDPPTARTLYANIDVGEQIQPEHFRAVAAAIRFAEAMNTKAKGQAWRK
ncbi:MAG: flagellar type III secretion system protein FlhB [Marinosulfonomonas sp.]|nr:flagellar type III secretion system protein FlhB [Marinosulfonomonas sp.]